jgi:hypothetical protein
MTPLLRLQLLWATVPPLVAMAVVYRSKQSPGLEPWNTILDTLICGLLAFFGLVFLLVGFATIALWVVSRWWSAGQCRGRLTDLIKLLPVVLLLGVEYLLPLALAVW